MKLKFTYSETAYYYEDEAEDADSFEYRYRRSGPRNWEVASGRVMGAGL